MKNWETMLGTWPVYARSADHQHKLVARRVDSFEGRSIATNIELVEDTLMDLRSRLLERGLVRIDRRPSDDPEVLEVWI